MKVLVLILAAAAAYGQTTRYPGALDSDSSLFVVSDNIQTTLNTAMATGDTAAVVASSAGFVPNMIATICDTTTNTGKCTAWEHMLVTAVAGNVLTVTRGFAGTSPRTHSSGRLVSVLIDSAHQKVLKDAVIAVQTALGPNLSNIAGSTGLVTAGAYNFAAYSCNSSSVCVPSGPSGMSLIAGNNTLTMTPVPNGVNGTNTGDSFYVSGGTGAAEACLITGGSGTSGQASGQIIIQCANSHSGAWTLTSASGGLQEAVCSFPSRGGSVTAVADITLRANVTDCGKTHVQVRKQAGATISGTFSVLNISPATLGEELFNNDVSTWTGASNQPAFSQANAPAYRFIRSTSDSPGIGGGRETLWVQLDTSGTAVTGGALAVWLRATNNSSNQGSHAISGYADVLNGSSAIFIGVHGECDIDWAGAANCVALNAEGSAQVGGSSSNATLIGLESNLNANSPANAPAVVIGAHIQMNNQNNNMVAGSAGAIIQATHGVTPVGVQIRDFGGTFTRPLIIESGLNPATNISLLSTATGNVDGPINITFSRGALVNTYAAIQGDNVPSGFATGTLTFKTAVNGVFTNALVLNTDGSASVGFGGIGGRAMCWKTDNKTLGYCSTTVGVSGTCTCN